MPSTFVFTSASPSVGRVNRQRVGGGGHVGHSQSMLLNNLRVNCLTTVCSFMGQTAAAAEEPNKRLGPGLGPANNIILNYVQQLAKPTTTDKCLRKFARNLCKFIQFPRTRRDRSMAVVVSPMLLLLLPLLAATAVAIVLDIASKVLSGLRSQRPLNGSFCFFSLFKGVGHPPLFIHRLSILGLR